MAGQGLVFKVVSSIGQFHQEHPRLMGAFHGVCVGTIAVCGASLLPEQTQEALRNGAVETLATALNGVGHFIGVDLATGAQQALAQGVMNIATFAERATPFAQQAVAQGLANIAAVGESAHTLLLAVLTPAQEAGIAHAMEGLSQTANAVHGVREAHGAFFDVSMVALGTMTKIAQGLAHNNRRPSGWVEVVTHRAHTAEPGIEAHRR